MPDVCGPAGRRTRNTFCSASVEALRQRVGPQARPEQREGVLLRLRGPARGSLRCGGRSGSRRRLRCGGHGIRGCRLGRRWLAGAGLAATGLFVVAVAGAEPVAGFGGVTAPTTGTLGRRRLVRALRCCAGRRWAGWPSRRCRIDHMHDSEAARFQFAQQLWQHDGGGGLDVMQQQNAAAIAVRRSSARFSTSSGFRCIQSSATASTLNTAMPCSCV